MHACMYVYMYDTHIYIYIWQFANNQLWCAFRCPSLVVLRRAFGPPGALEIDRTAGALEGALGQAATVWGLPSAAAGALGSHPVCLDPVCLHSVCLNAVCLDPVCLDPVCVGRSSTNPAICGHMCPPARGKSAHRVHFAETHKHQGLPWYRPSEQQPALCLTVPYGSKTRGVYLLHT